MRFQVIVTLAVSLFFVPELSAFQRIPGRAAPKVDVTAEQVRASIRAGRDFLRSRRQNGKWTDVSNFPYGTTGLCTLALLNAGGVPDEEIQESLDQLQRRSPESLSTYTVSLRIMAMALADPDGRRYRNRIVNDVRYLEKSQTKEGKSAGGWSYGNGRGNQLTADASNTQFAILALHEASLMGIRVDEKVWMLAKRYWTNLHRPGSGFVYAVGGGSGTPVTGSMTCAGISSWLIINENLAKTDDFLNGGRVACCGLDSDSQVVKEAIGWLSRNFTVQFNPVGRVQRSVGAKMYYLYGMERAGRLSGERFFGKHDWYRAGAAHLVSKQRPNGSWRSGGGHSESMEEISTAFALLFLSKGRRPVVFGKYQHGAGIDWDRHPKGIHYLTRQLESDWAKSNWIDSEWGQKLNWQTVRGENATVDDLLEAPVLFISGRDKLQLTELQQQNLKKYIENGGFIFAEACQGDGCGTNVEFDKSFRALVSKLFPESELAPLAADHPIWNAIYPIKRPDKGWPVLGLQACCRTSIVYCPRNLTGYWRLNRPNLMTRFPADVSDQVEYCAQLGVNIASYATGRHLDDKGDRPKVMEAKGFEMLAGRNLHFPKLSHSGGSDDAPNAWRNLQNEVRNEIGLRLKMDKKMILPVKEQLAEHPFVFMHGRNDFSFTKEERQAIKRYLELGGFIFADSICSSPEFTKAFRREFNKIFEDQDLQLIPEKHPIYNDKRFGWNLTNGVVFRTPDPEARNGVRQRVIQPRLESLEVEGRLVVIFSPYDISCAMENATATQCEGYARDDAVKIGTNVIMYRLRSD